MKRGMLPMFGGELKMQLDLAVTVPLAAPSVVVAGPPVREAARIQVNGRSPEEIADVRRRTTRLPAPRVPHADPFAPTRAAIAAAVEAMPPPQPSRRRRDRPASSRPAPGSGRLAHPASARPGRLLPVSSGPPAASRRTAGRCAPRGSGPPVPPPAGRARRSAPGRPARPAAAGCQPAAAAPGRAGPGRAGPVRARPGRRRALHPAARPGTGTAHPHRCTGASTCDLRRTCTAVLLNLQRHAGTGGRSGSDCQAGQGAKRPTDCPNGQARRVSPGPAAALSRRVAHQAGPPAGR